MKTVLKTIFLLIINFSCFSQNIGKEKLNLIFYSECSDDIITPEFDIDSIPESENIKILTYYIEHEDWVSQNTITVNLLKNDTIEIPRILFNRGTELHSQRWSYLNCGKICKGTETDYYTNGNKRLQGSFKDGKPSEIKFYRENGMIESQEIYELGTLQNTRVNYFDEEGKLLEYEIHKNLKRKTIIKTFDKNHKQVNKEVLHYYIE